MTVCQICCKDRKEAVGCLLLVVRMPVMIMENLLMQNKVINGFEGIVKKIIYRTLAEGCKAVCVHVHLWSSPITLNGLTPGVVPIFPRVVSFNCKLQQGMRLKISRTQLPLLPAWAFMDYKVQGASLKTVIIDLASAHSIQNAYVMLSCATRLAGLAVFRPFAPHCIFCCLPQDLRNELTCITWLDEYTRKWFQNQKKHGN